MRPFLPLLLLFLTACGSKKKEYNGLLHPARVPSQYFTVEGGREMRVLTRHGTEMTIPAGAFAAGKTVTLEVKEVFTPAELLQSGLTTVAGTKSLRSGGMIYFNATVGGQSAEPSQPVKVFLPAAEPDPAMQVFSGQLQADSTVDWKNPRALDTSLTADLTARIQRGSAVYKASCGNCHDVQRDGTGPAHKGLLNRGPWRNPRLLLAWLNNPAAFMASDAYTQQLKEKYGSMMTSHPALDMEDLKDLLAFMNMEARKPAPATASLPDTSKPGKAECGYDSSYIIRSNDFDEYDTSHVIIGGISADTAGKPFNLLDPEYQGIFRQGYRFDINANGWYNIDAYLDETVAAVQPVQLSAVLNMTEDVPAFVYLLVPSDRVMQAYETKKGNQYIFSKDGDQLPLPIGRRALVFAFTSVDKTIRYGISEFTIGASQTLNLDMRETTPEGLAEQLRNAQLSGIEIRAIEKELKVKPRPCPQENRDVINMPNPRVVN